MPYNVVSGIGLTLHELAANAIKHGAWSNGDGRVEVDWYEAERDALRCVEVRWEEADGPRVSQPLDSEGTGNAIIERLPSYGGGSIERQWHPEGLRVKVQFPIAGTAE